MTDDLESVRHERDLARRIQERQRAEIQRLEIHGAGLAAELETLRLQLARRDRFLDLIHKVVALGPLRRVRGLLVQLLPPMTPTPKTDAERIAELEATVAALRRRLAALVEVLPVELLPLLERDPPASVTAAPTNDPFAGWEDSSGPRRSTMAAELERLWRRV